MRPAARARGRQGELVRLDLATGAIDWRVKLDTMPLGAATVSNDLVFTTLFDGRVAAYSLDDGSKVWSAKRPAGTNAPVAIAGDTLVTAAGFPQGNQKPALVAFKLNGEAVTPPPSTDTTKTGGTTTEHADSTAGIVNVGVVSGALRFNPSQLRADAGKVTFRFTNPDSIGHDFVIEQGGKRIAGTELISNDSAEVTVNLEPGRYTFYCTPHRAAGMQGTLTVT